jgi:hypothetical protein
MMKVARKKPFPAASCILKRKTTTARMENPSDKILMASRQYHTTPSIRSGRRPDPQAAITRKAQAQEKRITFLAGMTLPD